MNSSLDKDSTETVNLYLRPHNPCNLFSEISTHWFRIKHKYSRNILQIGDFKFGGEIFPAFLVTQTFATASVTVAIAYKTAAFRKGTLSSSKTVALCSLLLLQVYCNLQLMAVLVDDLLQFTVIQFLLRAH
jgi:hypothetical protein